MPELPEIEAACKRLNTAYAGAKITSVRILRTDSNRGFVKTTFDGLRNVELRSFERRGKFVVIKLGDASVMVVHLGMSGRFVLRTPGAKHDIVGFEINGTSWLTYHDFRHFGRVWRFPVVRLKDHPIFVSLGPEPLSRAFDEATISPRSRRNVKSLLLDQTIVAGIGNIYACESLYAARINPNRPAYSLTERERRRLAWAIKTTLSAAISRGGSTLDDYRGTEGAAGDYDRFFTVFGREGLPCPSCNCAHGVRRIRQEGRSTYFCSVLQR